MKKTILVVLMVAIVTTPCLAQEIEFDEVFSIERTVWQTQPIGLQILPFPVIYPFGDLKFGFYGGEVYPNLESHPNAIYRDTLGWIIFSTSYPSSTENIGGTSPLYFGILQPNGIGILVEWGLILDPAPLPIMRIGLLIKAGANWTPPEIEERLLE